MTPSTQIYLKRGLMMRSKRSELVTAVLLVAFFAATVASLNRVAEAFGGGGGIIWPKAQSGAHRAGGFTSSPGTNP